MNLRSSEGYRAVRPLGEDHADAVVAVLCEAFREYPAMRYILGEANPAFDSQLRTLIRFFVAARFSRGEIVLGILDDDVLAAAAVATLPGDRPSPSGLAELREDVWLELGDAARARYELFGKAVGRHRIDRPHYHLNMIGVRGSHRGRGHARRLLEAVHEVSLRDPDSCGITLSTETRQNLSLYEHFGYTLLGHESVSDELETWVFFRPDPVSG